MGERRFMDAPAPRGGWQAPWPAVFEFAGALSPDTWSLVGGLMVQAHASAHGIDAVRPTADVDVLLHVEVRSDAARDAHRALTGLGYALDVPSDPRGPRYRYRRNRFEVVDVMAADHTAPRARQRIAGHEMFAMEGGTQALRRTIWLTLDTGTGKVRLSVPDELGALVLKGAAYRADSRDRERHLFDAALLCACITDVSSAVSRLRGSDRARLTTLARELAAPSSAAWLALPADRRKYAQDILRILATVSSSAAQSRRPLRP